MTLILIAFHPKVSRLLELETNNHLKHGHVICLQEVKTNTNKQKKIAHFESSLLILIWRILIFLVHMKWKQLHRRLFRKDPQKFLPNAHICTKERKALTNCFCCSCFSTCQCIVTKKMHVTDTDMRQLSTNCWSIKKLSTNTRPLRTKAKHHTNRDEKCKHGT